MKVKNILFIMADQLRWDYLSCYGHPHLKTPHLDSLAKKGVMFESAYVQAPVCGHQEHLTTQEEQYLVMALHGTKYHFQLAN